MKVIKLALIVALLTAGTGAVDAFVTATGEDWFSEATKADLPKNNWESLAGSIDEQNTGIFDSIFSILYYGYLLASLVWGAIKGALFIGSILSTYFYYNVDGANVARPICDIINVVVWLIYIIGFYQLRHGDSIKHYW